jgi:hypothetical protein
MFAWNMAIGCVVAMAEAEAEKQFIEKIRGLSPDVQSRMIEERKAAKEKARVEAIEERRHRELCDAIRASKPDPTYMPTEMKIRIVK